MARRQKKRGAGQRVGRRPTRPAQRNRHQIPSPPRPLHNLPAQTTTFIGREREIAEVKRLLATVRILTLTGAGGCGKTRLALQVAAEVIDGYPDGVWLVDFAPVADPALVHKTVASVLDVPEQPGHDMLETLVDALRPKALLLVLDNCEHLVASCADLAVALLRGCPHVRLLATSREALAVPGETLWRVPSLSVPDPGRLPPPEDLPQYEAVRLFVDRATATAPAFTVTRENALAVAQVCQRLDGIPLAIELAAARMKVLAVEQIAARLDDRFRLLTGGSRTAMPRHRTLGAVMDWSYDLLSEQEQTLLRRLSVFAGGWTLAAAETICSGDGVEASDILDVLTQLVGKSLVVVSRQGGEARYALLETVRQFGRDKLQESGKADDVQRRHRDWYLDFAEQTEPKLHGHEQDVWLNRLETEHDNLRAALGWSRTTKEGVDTELRLAIALGWFWVMNGDWSEGRRWLEDILSAGRAVDPYFLLKVAEFAGMFAYLQGDIDRMSELVEKRRALLEKVGGDQNVMRLRVGAGKLAIERGEVERAIPLLEEAVAIARELDDKWALAFALSNLADGVRIQGDYQRARHVCMESIKLFEEVGDRWRVSIVLRNMGIALLHQHDYHNAATFYADSIRLRNPAKNRFVVFQGLEGLACIACARGQYLRAARLFGAARPIQESLRATRDPDRQVEIAPASPLGDIVAARNAYTGQYVKATRTSLGEQAFSAAWADGRAMTLEQAIEYALALAGLEGRDQQPRASRPNAGRLTAREREVARLVARGLTNREIAATLVVTNRTAEAHVQNIRNKLGFNSRSQIAAWAVERGLSRNVETEPADLQEHPSQVRRAT